MFESEFAVPKWKEKLYQYRYYIVLLFLLIGLVLGVIGYFLWKQTPETKIITTTPTLMGVEKKERLVTEKIEKVPIVVDIKGAVQKPGVYTCEEQSRVQDVVLKAGGFTKEADSSVINLSRKVQDEMVIYIYSKQEVEKCKKEESKSCPIQEVIVPTCPSIDNTMPKEDEGNSKEEESIVQKVVSINTASLSEFMDIPGIGEAKAKLIVAYRTEHGPFEKLEDLMNVKGIGQTLYEKMLPYLKL